MATVTDETAQEAADAELLVAMGATVAGVSANDQVYVEYGADGSLLSARNRATGLLVGLTLAQAIDTTLFDSSSDAGHAFAPTTETIAGGTAQVVIPTWAFATGAFNFQVSAATTLTLVEILNRGRVVRSWSVAQLEVDQNDVEDLAPSTGFAAMTNALNHRVELATKKGDSARFSFTGTDGQTVEVFGRVSEQESGGGGSSSTASEYAIEVLTAGTTDGVAATYADLPTVAGKVVSLLDVSEAMRIRPKGSVPYRLVGAGSSIGPLTINANANEYEIRPDSAVSTSVSYTVSTQSYV